MKILIAGGGIGGLTAALCCLHHKHEVVILEKTDNESGDVGAGIQLPPNAMRVFQALGIAGEIASEAFQPDALEARMGHSGFGVFRVPLNERAMHAWGAPYLHIHRADYLGALKKCLLALAPHALRQGAQVSSFSQGDSSVSVMLASGERVSGDVLLGADGIHSTIRKQMLGPDQPRFTGQVAWRAVVPVEMLANDKPPPSACVWMGRGKHAVTYRLRRGTLANFVGVVERDHWLNESWSERGSKAEALADFAGWQPAITRSIFEAQALYRWALFDRPPLKTWVQGRVALLGDAAHPMLPFMAQGAAMAVEDAWTVAAALIEENRTAADSLLAYQQARFARASAVQAASRANANTFHQHSLAGQLKTYGPMWLAGKILPGAIRGRVDWLYGYDVIASTIDKVTSKEGTAGSDRK